MLYKHNTLVSYIFDNICFRCHTSMYYLCLRLFCCQKKICLLAFNGKYFKWVYIYYITIHKKEVCSRQKSPETWKCLPNPTFFTDFKSFGFSLENSATSKWMPFFIFFKNFILDFFCLSSIFQIVATFVNNHATSRAMFLFSSPRTFCLLTGRCGAKNTENEKWPPFWGRWMNLKTDSIFKLRKRNWIM